MDSQPLTEDEQRKFFELLRRVCENHVDQWLQMRVETSAGMPFFVDISLEPLPGEEDQYSPVDEDARLGDHWRTGDLMREEPRRRQEGEGSGSDS
jgi:hypothetical protein